MDMSIETVILVFLIISAHCVSGLGVPQPEKLAVNILDGEVIAVWEHPTKAPANSKFNVQMGNYSGEWAVVTSCTGISHTYCDLSSHIHDYRGGYKVKVQLDTGFLKSAWTSKKFLPSSSKLQPPSFTLWATSSTLTVYVHQKPILKKLFPFGPVYTIYVEEIGQDKNITAYLTDDVQEDQRAKTFSSLRWGREYCVSVMAEGKGALEGSSMSPKQCLKLPEQEWYIIAVSSLSVLAVLAAIVIMAAILQCYLRSPVKTPTVLKSPASGWVPFPLSEGKMEVVTDKGWFLFGDETEVKGCVKDQVTHLTVEKDNKEEDRRTSLDSGVVMGSGSVTDSGRSPPSRQEDSGCGSLGGPESSTSSQSDYPLQKDMTDDITRKREDSGLGLGCQLHSSSLNLDSGSIKKDVSRGNYHSQSPPTAQKQNVCVGGDDEFKQMLPEPVLAEVVTGYRAGPQTCICSGAGQCSWCHKQGLYGGEVIKQYKTMSIDNGPLSSKCDFVDAYKGGLTFPRYAETLQRNSIVIDGLGSTFVHLGETFPLLTGLAPLPLVEGGRDFSMSEVHLSLRDVQLTSD